MSTRREKQMIYRERYAEEKVGELCKFHNIAPQSRCVLDAVRFGFDEGVRWADRNQIGVLDEDYAWSVYIFIANWKNGNYGNINLQDAIKKYGKDEGL